MDGKIIYKAYGPALLMQEKEDALNVLQKRADFIKNEL
jgi:chaperonin cofactor prefoldin